MPALWIQLTIWLPLFYTSCSRVDQPISAFHAFRDVSRLHIYMVSQYEINDLSCYSFYITDQTRHRMCTQTNNGGIIVQHLMHCVYYTSLVCYTSLSFASVYILCSVLLATFGITLRHSDCVNHHRSIGSTGVVLSPDPTHKERVSSRFFGIN